MHRKNQKIANSRGFSFFTPNELVDDHYSKRLSREANIEELLEKSFTFYNPGTNYFHFFEQATFSSMKW